MIKPDWLLCLKYIENLIKKLLFNKFCNANAIQKTYSTTEKLMKKIAIPFFFLILSISLSAQTKQWTLQECVNYALENNISVKQRELDYETAELGKKDAFGNFLPTLNGTASNSWNTGLTQNVTTGVLQSQTPRNSSYNITVNFHF